MVDKMTGELTRLQNIQLMQLSYKEETKWKGQIRTLKLEEPRFGEHGRDIAGHRLSDKAFVIASSEY